MKAVSRLLLAALLLPALAGACDWTGQPDSTLGFTGTAQGESFDGRFTRFTPHVHFDPADLAATRFDVSIDLASADTANAERDELLHGADFFASNGAAPARFVASGARADGDGYVSHGDLTLKGISRPVSLHFRFTPTADGALLEGKATLDRIAFEVGAGEWSDAETIGHEVRVTTRLTLRAAP